MSADFHELISLPSCIAHGIDFLTACLSGAVKLARRQHGVRASEVENWSSALSGSTAAGAQAVVVFAHVFFLLRTFAHFSYTILTSSERGRC